MKIFQIRALLNDMNRMGEDKNFEDYFRKKRARSPEPVYNTKGERCLFPPVFFFCLLSSEMCCSFSFCRAVYNTIEKCQIPAILCNPPYGPKSRWIVFGPCPLLGNVKGWCIDCELILLFRTNTRERRFRDLKMKLVQDLLNMSNLHHNRVTQIQKQKFQKCIYFTPVCSLVILCDAVLLTSICF